MATRVPHALITGGSRGIGLAIAQLFARNAYRCTLVSRSETSLKAAVATLESQPSKAGDHHRHNYIVADVSHDSNFWTTDSGLSNHFGTYMPSPTTDEPDHPSIIDILVHCAGISQAKLFMALPQDSIHEIITTNLTSLMEVTRFLLRNRYIGRYRMSERRDKTSQEKIGSSVVSPVIINVSSLLGLSGGHGAVVYAASKAGVIGFTRALATEYSVHRTRVNAIVPGYIDTDMTRGLNQDDLTRRIPLGRFGKADEIAHAALFLAQNEYAHNCVVNLDGGLSAV